MRHFPSKGIQKRSSEDTTKNLHKRTILEKKCQADVDGKFENVKFIESGN